MQNTEDYGMDINNSFYKEHAKEFIENTINCDMSEQYKLFENHLPKEAKVILDLGFGSGRDSLYFQNKGYQVYALDPSEEFCAHAQQIGLKYVFNTKAEDMNFSKQFDGIWACASLLHIKADNLVKVFNKIYEALKDEGVVYCSFKYGEFEGIRNERYFVDMTHKKILNYVDMKRFKILEEMITTDVRKERSGEKWYNVILKRL